MEEKSFGKQLAATLITPSIPQAICARVRLSSPLTTIKSSGESLNICMHWFILPLASLIPLMFAISLARRIVVAAEILLPVLPGTLYKITGREVLLATAE